MFVRARPLLDLPVLSRHASKTGAPRQWANLDSQLPTCAGVQCLFQRWATKKAGGSSKNGRDSQSKRLGVKKFGGQAVIPGNILIRQRGQKYHAGIGVGMGKDHTIFATVEGIVQFDYHKIKKYQVVSVVPPKPDDAPVIVRGVRRVPQPYKFKIPLEALNL